MLAGVVVTTQLGVRATVFYLAVYLLMNLAAFAVIVARERESGVRRRHLLAVRARRRPAAAGVADDDRDARAGRLPGDGGLLRQGLPDRGGGRQRLRLARRRRSCSGRRSRSPTTCAWSRRCGCVARGAPAPPARSGRPGRGRRSRAARPRRTTNRRRSRRRSGSWRRGGCASRRSSALARRVRGGDDLLRDLPEPAAGPGERRRGARSRSCSSASAGLAARAPAAGEPDPRALAPGGRVSRGRAHRRVRDERGQAPVRVPVAILLVALVLGARRRRSRRASASAWSATVRTGLCIVGGDVCRPADAAAAGLAPCLTRRAVRAAGHDGRHRGRAPRRRTASGSSRCAPTARATVTRLDGDEGGVTAGVGRRAFSPARRRGAGARRALVAGYRGGQRVAVPGRARRGGVPRAPRATATSAPRGAPDVALACGSARRATARPRRGRATLATAGCARRRRRDRAADRAARGGRSRSTVDRRRTARSSAIAARASGGPRARRARLVRGHAGRAACLRELALRTARRRRPARRVRRAARPARPGRPRRGAAALRPAVPTAALAARLARATACSSATATRSTSAGAGFSVAGTARRRARARAPAGHGRARLVDAIDLGARRARQRRFDCREPRTRLLERLRIVSSRPEPTSSPIVRTSRRAPLRPTSRPAAGVGARAWWRRCQRAHAPVALSTRGRPPARSRPAAAAASDAARRGRVAPDSGRARR